MRSSPLLLLCGAAAAALPRGLPRGSGGHVDLHNVGHTRLHAATAHKTDDALLVGGGRGQWDKHNTQWSVRQVAEVSRLPHVPSRVSLLLLLLMQTARGPHRCASASLMWPK
jgi:hypothetical protein